MGSCRGRLPAAPAANTCAANSPLRGSGYCATAFSGVRASAGVEVSKSLISSISSMGVIPQMASGLNTLSRKATAPISFPFT